MKEAILPISFLYLFGCVQGLFIAGYLLMKPKKNRQVALCLSILLIGLCLTLYDYFILQNSLHRQVSHFLLLSYSFQLAYAPLTYFTTRGIVFPLQKFKEIEWLHFLPALLHLSYGIFIFHRYPLTSKVEYVDELITQLKVLQPANPPIFLLFNFFVALQLLAYLGFSFQLIRQYKVPSQLHTAISNKKLYWLFGSIVGINLVLLLFSLNIRQLILQTLEFDIGVWVLLLLALYLFYLAYFIVLNPTVFEPPTIKYSSSTLNPSQKEELVERLEAYMQSDKPYSNGDLTIAILAEKLETSSRQLSQVINEAYSSNFYDFVNSYRIKAAQALLRKKESVLSIEGIGYEVGFNSKSSFYASFKKFTGMTPRAYQNSQHSDI